MNPLRFLRVIFVSFFTLLSAVGNAHAHAFLENSEPRVGSKVKAPKQLALHFSEEFDAAQSSVKIFAPDGKEVRALAAKPDHDDPSILRVMLPALAPGIYKVQWRAVCEYNHTTSGNFSFQIVR